MPPPRFALPLPLSSLPCHSPSAPLLASPRLGVSMLNNAFANHSLTVTYFAIALPYFAIAVLLYSLLSVAIPLRVYSPLCHSFSSLHFAFAMRVKSQPFSAAAVHCHAMPLPFAARLCTAPARQFIALPLLCPASPCNAFAHPVYAMLLIAMPSHGKAIPCHAIAPLGYAVAYSITSYSNRP